MKNLFLSLVFLFMMSSARSAVLCKDKSATSYTHCSVAWSPAIGKYGDTCAETCYTEDGGTTNAWYAIGAWGSDGTLVDIVGNSKCSGPYDPNSMSGGTRCWCQMQMIDNSVGKWVMIDSTYTSSSYCRQLCAGRCLDKVLTRPEFRTALCAAADS
jgi:hypothetical protein